MKHIYKMYRETSPIVHRKIDRFEMNIKIPYCLAVFI